MLFYYTVLFIFYIFSLFEILNLNTKQRLIVFFLFSFILYVLSFIRWETGTDWDTYKSFFDSPSYNFDNESFEPLYSALNTLVSHYIGDYTVLLFVLSSFLFYFQIKGIYKLSVLPITSLFILVGIYFGNINYIRQTIATCILFYSIIYIQKKDFIRFILLVTLAFFFHRSSIIFIFAWWIFKCHISKKFMIVTIVLSVFLSSLMYLLMSYLGDTIGGIVKYKIDFYLSESDAIAGSDHSYALIVFKGIINKCFIFILTLILFNKTCKKYPIVRNYLNIYWFGIILYFSLIGVSIALIRFSFPFDFIQIILIPLLLNSIERKSNKLIFLHVLTLYLVLRLYSYITSYYELYIPFKTIFN